MVVTTCSFEQSILSFRYREVFALINSIVSLSQLLILICHYHKIKITMLKTLSQNESTRGVRSFISSNGRVYFDYYLNYYLIILFFQAIPQKITHGNQRVMSVIVKKWSKHMKPKKQRKIS